MKRVKWNVSAGAVLTFALIYFFDGSGVVSAAVPAVAAHELGHCLALWLCGKRLCRVTVSLAGIELNYSGMLEGVTAIFCIAAGPLFGLVYAIAAYRIGSAFSEMTGAVSLALTLFNLLPVLPLDGGRLVFALTTPAFGERFSKVMSVLLLLGSLILLIWFRISGPLLPAAWLMVCNFRR